MKTYNCGPYFDKFSIPADDYATAVASAGLYAESIELVGTTMPDGQSGHYVRMVFEEEGLLVYKIVNPKHANYILEYEILQQEPITS